MSGSPRALVPRDIVREAFAAFPDRTAIVTDAGGILSHCAVVAREYSIPAVVGTKLATSTIRTGQLIEVDGTSGSVRIIEP